MSINNQAEVIIDGMGGNITLQNSGYIDNGGTITVNALNGLVLNGGITTDGVFEFFDASIWGGVVPPPTSRIQGTINGSGSVIINDDCIINMNDISGIIITGAAGATLLLTNCVTGAAFVKAENMAFRQAVEVVTGTTPTTAPIRREAEPPPKTLILPESVGIPLRLYDYLCMKRGINGDVVNTLMQKEKLYEDRRSNVVFVGHDEQGAARFASLRGTGGDFRGDCSGSDKRYGFNAVFAPSNRLYCYESPIDLTSHASLVNAATGNVDAWKQHSRLSLAGTSDTALPFFLNTHKGVQELVLCLDNDPAGREAAAIIARKYAAKGYTVLIDFPQGKDFNADLTEKIKLDKAEKNAVKMHNKKPVLD